MTTYTITARNWLAEDWRESFGKTAVTVDQEPRVGYLSHPKTGKSVRGYKFPYSAICPTDQRCMIVYYAQRLMLTEQAVELLLRDRVMAVPVEDADVQKVDES